MALTEYIHIIVHLKTSRCIPTDISYPLTHDTKKKKILFCIKVLLYVKLINGKRQKSHMVMLLAFLCLCLCLRSFSLVFNTFVQTSQV